ncbi:MAG: hypothetical protein ACPGLV_04030, partial [Bacteroidia bacterium]
MKIFGIDFSSSKAPKPINPQITNTDREWIDSNLEWLITALGYPKGNDYTYTNQNFANSFKNQEFNLEHLVEDFCNLLGLNAQIFKVKIYKDLRDENIPFGFENDDSDCFIDINHNQKIQTIYIQNQLLQNKTWLLKGLCLEFTRFYLSQNKMDIGDDEDSHLGDFIEDVTIASPVDAATDEGLTEATREVLG